MSIDSESGFGAPREGDPWRRSEKMQRERDEARVQLTQARRELKAANQQIVLMRHQNEQMRAVLKKLRGVTILNSYKELIDKCLAR